MADPAAPDVSAVIPCHKQAQFLPDAIESVLSQAGPRAEVLVVDDGPDDAVAAACAPFGGRVRLLRQKNAGVSAARNAGIAASRGRYLHFLDADDRIGPGLYERSVGAMDARPEWMLTLCGTRFMFPDGRMSERAFGPLPAGRAFARVLEGCPPIGALVVRREALDQVGGFDPALPETEDWDLFLRLARLRGDFGSIPEELFFYRIHPQGKSTLPEVTYRFRMEVLERACRPDPRVKDPDPSFAQGGDPAQLPLRKARMAVYSAGLALGTGDAKAAAKYVRAIFEHLDGAKPPHEFLTQMYQLAARPFGLVDPPPGELYERCAKTLAALRKEFPARSPLGAYAKKIEKAFRGPLPKRAWWKAWF
ncbi:MAG: glycosyltransferase family 2 protein [Planctomycetota bacterium]|nr:glycosyltransferase family 2 protein [Planctomycetota bacterium]